MKRFIRLAVAGAMMLILAVPAAATTGADVSDEPDLLQGFCTLFTFDTESELIWTFRIHDPASGCVDGFPFGGHEITISNLREGLLWNVVGFDEGNVIQLDGVVESVIFAFDADAVAAGTPIGAFLTEEWFVADGPVSVNLNFVGTQADGEGFKVMEITFRGRGTLITSDGSEVAFTASVHEEIAAMLPGLAPTTLISNISLRDLN